VSVPNPRSIRVVGLLVATSLGLAGCSGGHDVVDQQAGGTYRYTGATERGKMIAAADRRVAGNATAPYLDDSGTWQLADENGKIVVLNYWASNCGPCVTETPAFEKIYRGVKDKGGQFIGIDVREVSKSKAKSFIANNDVTYPIVYDQRGKTAIELGKVPSAAIPYTVLIDKQGRVAAVYFGALGPGDLTPVLDRLVAEPG